MTWTRFPIVAAVAGVAFVGACQLVAGVRTDGVLGTGGAGGTGTASSTTSHSGGSGGGTLDGGPCTPDSCAGGACKGGMCVHPTCTPHGLPFDVFTSAELGGNLIDDKLAAVSAGGAIHVAASDFIGHRLVIRTLHPGSTSPVGPMTEVPISSGGSFFSNFGRGEGNEVVFYGRFGDEIGEVRVPTDAQGVTAGGMPVSYPALPPECAPNTLHTVLFAGDEQTVKYVASCEGATTDALITGNAGAAASVIASSATKDLGLHVETFSLVDGTSIVGAGDAELGEFYVRTGKTAAELATPVPLRFSNDANMFVGLLGTPAHPGGAGVTLFGAQFMPAPSLKGYIWSGVVTDYAKLADVPPPGVVPILGPDPLPVIGKVGPLLSTPSGIFLATAPLDGMRAALSWFSPEGEPLLFGQDVFVTPDGGAAQVLAVTLATADIDTVVVWVEQSGATHRVRSQRVVCSY